MNAKTIISVLRGQVCEFLSISLVLLFLLLISLLASSFLCFFLFFLSRLIKSFHSFQAVTKKVMHLK